MEREWKPKVQYSLQAADRLKIKNNVKNSNLFGPLRVASHTLLYCRNIAAMLRQCCRNITAMICAVWIQIETYSENRIGSVQGNGEEDPIVPPISTTRSTRARRGRGLRSAKITRGFHSSVPRRDADGVRQHSSFLAVWYHVPCWLRSNTHTRHSRPAN